MKDLSIIVPAYNEGETIEASVTDFLTSLPRTLSDVLLEFIVVENGSTDDTWPACERLQKKFPDLVRIFSNKHANYGGAIKRGMEESRGEYLSILECDCLHVRFVTESLPLLRYGETPFVVGTKNHPVCKRNRSLYRNLCTSGFNMIIRLFLGYPGTETHGLKSIKTDLAKELCRLAHTSDELFQTEIVLIAWRLGYHIEEIPFIFDEVRPPRISVLRRMPMFVKLIQRMRRSLSRFPSRPRSSREL